METATNKQILKLFWRSSLRYPVATFIVLACSVLAHVANLIGPWYLKRLVDLLALGPSTVGILRPILITVFIIVGLDLLQQLFWRGVGFSSNYLQPRVMADLTDEAFQKTIHHSHQFFQNTFAGAVVRKINRLSSSFEEIADQITFAIIPLSITIVGAIIGVSLRSPMIAAVVAAWVLLFIIIQYWFSLWKQPAETRKALVDSETTGVLADAITNTTTIRLFTGREFEIEKFRLKLNDWRAAMERAWRLNEYGFAVQALSMAVIWGVVLMLAVRQWQRGDLTVGDFILLHAYLNALFHQLWDISRVFRRLYSSFANAAEIVEIMDTTPDILDKATAKPLVVREGRIELKKVEFRYHMTRAVLSNFSLDIKPGERIALVGPSGAGKTTVTHLLLRLFDVTAGGIFIDGQNIANAKQESLRAAIAYVPQDPVLFHRTLMENIRYGRREATDDEVVEAARRAHCHEFIDDLPQKYETYVGERGVKLSGGERQRVAIARAILKNAPILVLDEATSSLDSESESLIQEALHELMSQKTSIVIAHRLSTIMEMDRIIVIDEGKVQATGTHDELKRGAGTYQKLWEIQAGGFIP